MKAADKLAHAVGRRDDTPNVDLAVEIVASSDKRAVATLVATLATGSRPARSDAIKVLYEVGFRDPGLIRPHRDQFLDALSSPNNRLVWGALKALDAIATVDARALARHLPALLQAARTASVIGRDAVVSILCKLTRAGFSNTAVPGLLELLEGSHPNQLPMYAEQAAAAIPPSFAADLHELLESRLNVVEQASKRARIERVLRKLP